MRYEDDFIVSESQINWHWSGMARSIQKYT